MATQKSTSADANLFTDWARVNGKTILEVTPIAACPFCGETVEACRVK